MNVNNYHNRFTALFPVPPGWAGARRELLDFMVQGKINRGRHTDHPAGRHSIRTNQCPPPSSSPYFLQAGIPFYRPTNSVKALKARWMNVNKGERNDSVLFEQRDRSSPLNFTLQCAMLPHDTGIVMWSQIVMMSLHPMYIHHGVEKEPIFFCVHLL